MGKLGKLVLICVGFACLVPSPLSAATNLYVGNLPDQVTEEGLREAFARFGEIESVNLITKNKSGESRGFGYVVFLDPQAAQTAISEMNGTNFEGNIITVQEIPFRPGNGNHYGVGHGSGHP
jgi:RNA recognition motif-containing protein